MILTLRFAALVFLIAVAVFTGPVAPVCRADACSDRCLAELQQCQRDCKGSQSCIEGCVLADKKCQSKCNAPIVEQDN